MQLDQKQQKKVEKLAKYLANKDAEVFNYLFSILEEVAEIKNDTELKQILASMEIPDYSEQLKEINEKLDKEEDINITLNIV